MNWLDTTRQDRFGFEMVEPHDLSRSRGWMQNITSGSITQGYYTDTRVSGKIDGVDTGYITNSLIRIHHYVDAEGYHEELGTFFVTGMDEKEDKGVIVQSFTLSSMLCRISDDVLEQHYVYPQSCSYLNTVLKGMFQKWGVEWTTDGMCNDVWTSEAKVFECEDKKLSTVFDICDTISARLDVDGHGNATIRRYILPSNREAIFSLRDDNGTIASEIVISEPRFDVTNRVVARYTKDDCNISAWADRPSSEITSFEQTGIRKAVIESADELADPKMSNLQIYANNKLAEIEGGSRTKQFNCIYFPCQMGNVVTLKDDEGTKNYMLQDRDIDLKAGMPCSVTLKEL